MSGYDDLLTSAAAADPDGWLPRLRAVLDTVAVGHVLDTMDGRYMRIYDQSSGACAGKTWIGETGFLTESLELADILGNPQSLTFLGDASVDWEDPEQMKPYTHTIEGADDE